VRHLINEPGRNHSYITLVRHYSNESSNNTHVQCWITRAKIRKKPNLSLFYFFFRWDILGTSTKVPCSSAILSHLGGSF